MRHGSWPGGLESRLLNGSTIRTQTEYGGSPKIRGTFEGGYRGDVGVIWGYIRVQSLGFPKVGVPYGGPHAGDYSILGSILGSP